MYVFYYFGHQVGKLQYSLLASIPIKSTSLQNGLFSLIFFSFVCLFAFLFRGLSVWGIELPNFASKSTGLPVKFDFEIHFKYKYVHHNT